MEKLNMRSKDLTKENIEKIGQLFPNVITEVKDKDGNITHAIDFELLQQELSDEIVKGNKERYQLTWPGKKETIVRANTPIDKTLRPVKEDSLNWEDTENLYIEGDNLEVLKLLQESYLNKVKCIYIDPPYNTGKDFIYKDKFVQDKDEYAQETGQIDEDGNRLFQNTEYNGRYHSDWLTMMYPRLKLARNLLSDDGVIFISIDDNEVHNLRKICDEVFGERNFVNCITVKMSEVSGNKMSHADKRFPKVKEYILIYKKHELNLIPVKLKKEEWDGEYNKIFSNFTKNDRNLIKTISEKEVVTEDDIAIVDSILSKVEEMSVNQAIKESNIHNNNLNSWLIENSYRIFRTASSSSVKVLVDEKRKTVNSTFISVLSKKDKNLYIAKTSYSAESRSPRVQVLFADSYLEYTLGDLWTDISTTGLEFEGDVDFKNGKKPVKMIERLIDTCGGNDFIVLDFFSGSGTTAEAVFRSNIKDKGKGKRKVILVQLNEDLDKAYQSAIGDVKRNVKATIDFLDSINKPHFVTEIGKERIRRAGKKIKEETGADIDYGFRVYKVDSTNMKDVYYRPDELKQNFLDQLESNIKEDRTSLDLLTQVMLEAGLELSLPIETKDINGKEVHFVAENSLVACFDEDVDEELIKQIAKIEPLKVVFRDNSFKSCPDRINLEEIFKSLSPRTEIKVL